MTGTCNSDMTDNAKSTPPSAPAIFLPFNRGEYDTKPNLYRLGHDFGHGRADSKVLLIDSLADAYRQEKLAIRDGHLDQHYCDKMSRFDSALVNRYMVSTLLDEYPEFFTQQLRDGGIALHNKRSGETLLFDQHFHFREVVAEIDIPGICYCSGMDALANQVQEDICVLKIDAGIDELVCAHLCFPNKWSPNEKLGGSFLSIHQPVAGFESENPNAASLVKALINGGKYIRFAWGLSSDEKLNHHPDRAGPVVFRGNDDPLYIRVERQVLVGMSPANLLIFFIHTYYYDCRQICCDGLIARSLLRSIQSMKPDTLDYKGLSGCHGTITGWLEDLLDQQFIQ